MSGHWRHTQHFTVGGSWLTPPVRAFIAAASPRRFVDPFAGQGHLLRRVAEAFGGETAGYEIDAELCRAWGWTPNDSLAAIPAQRFPSVCVTNPPYLSRGRATRRGGGAGFDGLANLYEVGLRRCLARFDHVVAIVPRTLLQNLRPEFRARLALADAIGGPVFARSRVPVLTACFGPAGGGDPPVFADGAALGTLGWIEGLLPDIALPGLAVRFDRPDGQIALAAFDSGAGRIRFHPADRPPPRRANAVPHRIWLSCPVDGGLVAGFNALLEGLRRESRDLVLPPFWGAADGRANARLTRSLASRIIHKAVWWREFEDDPTYGFGP